MKYVRKLFSNRRIHIGLVARCKKDEKYGLLYGFRKPKYKGYKEIIENKLFFFEKVPTQEIADNTLVSYLSFDYDEFSSKAEYVYPLSELVDHRDRKNTKRADKLEHDDVIWRLINEGKPYYDHENGRNYSIFYPIIEKNICTIWQGHFGSNVSREKEGIILQMNDELSRIGCFEWPSLEDVTNAVMKFKKYIDSINVQEIIDTFEIKTIGRYVSRPGGDDYFYKKLSHYLPNDDKYLKHLLPTKEETIFLDQNAYPRDGYKSGDTVLSQETLEARKNAKKEYSKEKHLAFLINDYFTLVKKKKERFESIKQKIRDEFDIVHAYKIASQFNGDVSDEFFSLINKYNESTKYENLYLHTTIKNR